MVTLVTTVTRLILLCFSCNHFILVTGYNGYKIVNLSIHFVIFSSFVYLQNTPPHHTNTPFYAMMSFISTRKGIIKMILDLPPQTEQAIIATAQAQGITVAELLKQTFVEPDVMLNSDLTRIELEPEQFNKLMALLDEPPKPNPHLQNLLRLTTQM